MKKRTNENAEIPIAVINFHFCPFPVNKIIVGINTTPTPKIVFERFSLLKGSVFNHTNAIGIPKYDRNSVHVLAQFFSSNKK